MTLPTPYYQIQLGGHRSGSPVRGYSTVDAADSELDALHWSVDNGYAYRTTGARSGQRKILLHRVVMERVIGRPLVAGEQTDHINGDTLDNRRANLRVLSKSANMQNRRGPQKNSTSGLRGVTWNKRAGMWVAQARTGGKTHFFGHFTDKHSAAAAAERGRFRLGFAKGAQR